MKHPPVLPYFLLGSAAIFLTAVSALAAAPFSEALAGVKTKADLDALAIATEDATLKKALQDDTAAILSAAAMRPHIEAVIRTIESSPGKFEKINLTPEALKRAAGADIPLFDTLKLVDLSIPNAGPHDSRKTDPYDAAFFDHLSHIASLESVNIIATKANDEWIAPLQKLTNLKSLRFTNNGRLTDAGLEHLAGLRGLDTFAFVGTEMQGHAFAKFDGWISLKKCSFRGSKLDDEGLRLFAEHCPNIESLSLAHAKFTDSGAPNLAKMAHLKSLELGTPNATPQALRHIGALPLENLQLGEGFDSPTCIPYLKGISSLRRLTLTEAKNLADTDLLQIAALTQLESLELNNLQLPDARIPQLKIFSRLKSLRLVRRPQPYPVETQTKIKELLPKTELKFQ